jgi:hypothetical protein
MIGRYQEKSDSALRDTLAVLQSHVSWADFVCVLLPVARFPSITLDWRASGQQSGVFSRLSLCLRGFFSRTA